MMSLGHVLDHMPDHVMDHMIIGLVTMALHYEKFIKMKILLNRDKISDFDLVSSCKEKSFIVLIKEY